MFLGTAILLLGLHLTAGQDANCDFYQQVQAGRTYTINSPNWPNSYRPGITCRWIADCPSGSRCRLRCNEISLPQSASCSVDRLLVSLTGNAQLNGAQTYCGSGTLNVLSTGTRISMGLVANARSPGGRFSCQVSSEGSSNPPPPPPPTCRCGDRRRNRIVGGVETGINEFPSMAAIVDGRISQIRCGSIIISQWHALTAAHCVAGESAANYAIVVGEHDVTIGDSPATQAYRISAFNNHPWYSSANYDYDISIVMVASIIAFNDRVGPACLPFKFQNNNFAGARVTLLGWGTLFPGGPVSNTLQKVDVDVISAGTCRSQIPNLTDRQMCTFTSGKDACQYDSGGPVLYTDPATGLLFNVGIISSGRYCASNYPGINTRVTSVLSWITQNTPGANYCNIQ